MGAGRKKAGQKASGVTSLLVQQREQEQETVRLINKALESPQDLTQLQKIAAAKGLVNSQLRGRCWPLLLGLDSQLADPEQYEQWHSTPHRDSSVVTVDVDRSLWAFTPDASDEERATRRAELTRLLNAAVMRHGAGRVYYYQGLHDVASILLMTVGEEAAFPILCHLTTCHLRDCTRSSLEPIMELLGLLYPILQAADRPLAAELIDSGLPPFFALSWVITWFAHDAASLQDGARLFDLFLSSHPLMPLYLGAVAVRSHREELLACGGEMPELHTRIVNMRLNKHLPTDELIAQALALYRDVSPDKLVRRARCPLALCVVPAAKLQRGRWVVPAEPPGALGSPVAASKSLALVAAALRSGGGGLVGGPLALVTLLMELLSGRGLAGKASWRVDGGRALLTTVVSLTGLASIYAVTAIVNFTLSSRSGHGDR